MLTVVRLVLVLPLIAACGDSREAPELFSGVFSPLDERIGPQTVTVVAAGYVTTTWVGIAGANVTIPLEPPPALHDRAAHVSGTVSGLASLPPVAASRERVVAIGFTLPEGSVALDEVISRVVSGALPGNTGPPGPGDEHAFSVAIRAGATSVFAVALDHYAAEGPFETAEVGLAGFAYPTALSADPGQTVDGLRLEVVGRERLASLEVRWARRPDFSTEVSGFAAVNVPGDGWMLVPSRFVGDLRLVPQVTRVLVPALVGDLAAADYSVLLVTSGASTLRRHIRDPDAGVDLPPFLAQPGPPLLTGRRFAFEPVEDALMATVDLRDVRGNPLWHIESLDGSGSFALPPITPDPLQARPFEAFMSVHDEPFDPGDFALSALRDVTLVRRATTQAQIR